MGFAIIIIVFYHFCNSGGLAFFDKAVRLFFSQGYVGVDIFMVVSGLGLTYSLTKNESLKDYYIKRWVRIFPFFTFITLIECWIIRGEPFELALLRSTTLGYWFGFPYIDWYIPALVGLYVVFPFVFHTIVKPRRYYSALLISILFLTIGMIISKLEVEAIDWKHQVFIYRIPDFLMGCMAAEAIMNGYRKDVVKKLIGTSVLIGLLIFAFKLGGKHYIWFLNLCFTPLYLLLLCNAFYKFSSLNFGSRVLWPFGFLGLFTLELYRISSSFERLLIDDNCPQYHFAFVILYFVASVVLSYITYIAFKHINNYLYKIFRKL